MGVRTPTKNPLIPDSTPDGKLEEGEKDGVGTEIDATRKKILELLQENPTQHLCKVLDQVTFDEFRRLDDHSSPNRGFNIAYRDATFARQYDQLTAQGKNTVRRTYNDAFVELHETGGFCAESVETYAQEMHEVIEDKIMALKSFAELKKLDEIFHNQKNAGLAALKDNDEFKELYDDAPPVVKKFLEEQANKAYAKLHTDKPSICTDSAEELAQGMPELIEEKIMALKSFAELKKLDEIFHNQKNAGLAALKDNDEFKELYDDAPPVVKKFLEEQANKAYAEVHKKAPSYCAESVEEYLEAIPSEIHEQIQNISDPVELEKLIGQIKSNPKKAGFELMNRNPELAELYSEALEIVQKEIEKVVSLTMKDGETLKELEQKLKQPLLDAQESLPVLLSQISFDAEDLLKQEDFDPKGVLKNKKIQSFLAAQKKLLNDKGYKELVDALSESVETDLAPRWEKEQQQAFLKALEKLQPRLKGALQLTNKDIANEDYHSSKGQELFHKEFLKRALTMFPDKYSKNAALLAGFSELAQKEVEATYKRWEKLHEEHHTEVNKENYSTINQLIHSAEYDKSEVEGKKELFESPEAFRNFFIKTKLQNHADALKEMQEEAPKLYNELMIAIDGTQHANWKQEYISIENERLNNFQARANEVWQQQPIDIQDPQYFNNPDLFKNALLAYLSPTLDPTLLENEQEAVFRTFQDQQVEARYREWMTQHQKYREEALKSHQAEIENAIDQLQTSNFTPEQLANETLFLAAAQGAIHSQQWPGFLCGDLEAFCGEKLQSRYRELATAQPQLVVKQPLVNKTPLVAQTPLAAATTTQSIEGSQEKGGSKNEKALNSQEYHELLGDRLLARLMEASPTYQKMNRIDSEAFAPFFKAWAIQMGEREFSQFLRDVSNGGLGPVDFMHEVFAGNVRKKAALAVKFENKSLWRRFEIGLARLGCYNEVQESARQTIDEKQKKESLIIHELSELVELFEEEEPTPEDEEDELDANSDQSLTDSTLNLQQWNTTGTTDVVYFDDNEHSDWTFGDATDDNVGWDSEFFATSTDIGFSQTTFDTDSMTVIDTGSDQGGVEPLGYDSTVPLDSSFVTAENFLSPSMDEGLFHDELNNSYGLDNHLHDPYSLDGDFTSLDGGLSDPYNLDGHPVEGLLQFWTEQPGFDPSLLAEFPPDDPTVEAFGILSQLGENQELAALLSEQGEFSEGVEWFLQEINLLILAQLTGLSIDEQKWAKLIELKLQYEKQWWLRLGFRLSSPQDFERFFENFKRPISVQQVLQLFAHYCTLLHDRTIPVESSVHPELLEQIVHEPQKLFWSMVMRVKTFIKGDLLHQYTLKAHKSSLTPQREKVYVQLGLVSSRTNSVEQHEALIIKKTTTSDMQEYIINSFKNHIAEESTSHSREV